MKSLAGETDGTTTARVEIHDISKEMNRILDELADIKSLAIDPAAVQRTIDQIEKVKTELGQMCCHDDQGCSFEVVNATTRVA